MREKLIYGLACAGGLLLIRNLYVILLGFENEASQGAIYRIIFFHVPCWFICFSAYALAGGSSMLYLWKRKTVYDDFAVSAVEVGVVFTAIGLATGSIWARIIWGIWWTWDPRLTWAFICLLVYMGYLMLRRAIDDPTERAKNSGVLCIFAFTSVVITYKAIDWWRTQHPAAVLTFRTGGGNIEPAWEHMLLSNFLALGLISTSILMIRMRQERTQREVDALRRRTHEL
jgi:heme exporter protein C